VSARLTACVITYNEEANMADCLRSLAFCSEIVVVDSHSTDRTREIARGLGARVIERDWPGHIEQKNFAIDQASHDWVLCLDADERVTSGLRQRIEEVLARPDADGYLVNRKNIYLGGWIRHCGWYPERKLRLFRRSRGRWRGINPHDHVHLEPPGPALPLRADLEHYTYADIEDHISTMNYFSSIAASEKLARGQRWVTLNLLLNPPLTFLKMFFLRGGFLDGWRGFLVSALGSYYVFLRYAKLWELIHVKGLRPGGGARVSYGRRGERVTARLTAAEEPPGDPASPSGNLSPPESGRESGEPRDP
jgi:glycosyltransferase involved in cell wall biosynthesis